MKTLKGKMLRFKIQMKIKLNKEKSLNNVISSQNLEIRGVN